MTTPARQGPTVDESTNARADNLAATPAHKPKDVESSLDEALDESFPASDPPAILIA